MAVPCSRCRTRCRIRRTTTNGLRRDARHILRRPRNRSKESTCSPDKAPIRPSQKTRRCSSDSYGCYGGRLRGTEYTVHLWFGSAFLTYTFDVFNTTHTHIHKNKRGHVFPLPEHCRVRHLAVVFTTPFLCHLSAKVSLLSLLFGKFNKNVKFVANVYSFFKVLSLRKVLRTLATKECTRINKELYRGISDVFHGSPGDGVRFLCNFLPVHRHLCLKMRKESQIKI